MKICTSIVSAKKGEGKWTLIKLDTNDGIYQLEGISAEIWEALEQGETPENIFRSFSQQYPGQDEVIKDQLLDFFKKLEKLKILV